MTETGTEDDVIWAQQSIDALLELKEAAGAAREAGRGTIDPEILEKHCRWFREAADAGIVLNAARRSKLQKKRNALATRMRDRGVPLHRERRRDGRDPTRWRFRPVHDRDLVAEVRAERRMGLVPRRPEWRRQGPRASRAVPWSIPMAPGCGRSRRVSGSRRWGREPWSPDPERPRLVYPWNNASQLYDVETGTVTALGLGFWSSWSPDGKRLATWSNGVVVVDPNDAPFTPDEIVRVFPSFSGSCQDHERLSGLAVCGQVTWSPDGTRLLGKDIAGMGIVSLPANGVGDAVLLPGTGAELGAWQPLR